MNGPRWIKQWIADLALLNEQFRNDDGSVDFEALGREEYMFRTALITQRLEKSERARDTYMKAKAAYDASSENGKKGGRPRKNPEEISTDDQETEDRQSQGRTGVGPVRGGQRIGSPVRSGRNSRCPNSREDFHAFVADNKLHEGLAEEWYAIHEARGWVDETGNPIKNWRGALYNYCTKTEQKRRTA